MTNPDKNQLTPDLKNQPTTRELNTLDYAEGLNQNLLINRASFVNQIRQLEEYIFQLEERLRENDDIIGDSSQLLSTTKLMLTPENHPDTKTEFVDDQRSINDDPHRLTAAVSAPTSEQHTAGDISRILISAHQQAEHILADARARAAMILIDAEKSTDEAVRLANEDIQRQRLADRESLSKELAGIKDQMLKNIGASKKYIQVVVGKFNRQRMVTSDATIQLKELTDHINTLNQLSEDSLESLDQEVSRLDKTTTDRPSYDMINAEQPTIDKVSILEYPKVKDLLDRQDIKLPANYKNQVK